RSFPRLLRAVPARPSPARSWAERRKPQRQLGARGFAACERQVISVVTTAHRAEISSIRQNDPFSGHWICLSKRCGGMKGQGGHDKPVPFVAPESLRPGDAL